MNVLIIPEDFTKDQYVLQPLITAMLARLGRPRALVRVCQEPRLGGIAAALRWERIREILDRSRMVDLILHLVDRDCDDTRRASLDRLEQQANEHLRAAAGSGVPRGRFFSEHAFQEIEVWALAGLELPSEWRWQDVRSERDPKERYFLPLAQKRGLLDEPGQGRKTLGKEAAARYEAALHYDHHYGTLPAELRSPHQPAAADVARLATLLRPGLLARSPATAEYANFLFLYEYARASRASAVVAANRSTLQAVFQHAARLELQLAVAQAMSAGGVWCRPALSTTRAWAFQGLVHPLLAEPQALSVQAGEQSLFISGQNGRGKSTLLRAVGLGLATFRAFGFAHAQAATLPHVAVWSSLQMDDSIAQGRSLYMSELDRAAVMLSVARQGTPVVFLVDELFRGTNHVESVAASAATLQALGASACVLATSHNLVLAALLKPGFDAVRVVLGDGGHLRIEPGVLADTNGIGLMSTHGIAAPLAARAQAIGDWYAGCVAHPDALPPALLQ